MHACDKVLPSLAHVMSPSKAPRSGTWAASIRCLARKVWVDLGLSVEVQGGETLVQWLA